MSYPRRIPLGHPVRRGGAILALTLALAACGEGGSPAGTIEVDGSFARIVNEVLSPSCATSGCHVSGSGQVALSGAGAYDALVNATPTHPGARLAGLKRVVPGRPDSSLLYLRLLAPTHPLPIDLGPVMPEGRAPLTAGQVEYLLQWIAAGAPRRGEVADAALLADKTAQTQAAFQPLVAPAAGTGIQLRVEPFTVAKHFERELFVHRRAATTTDLYVRRIHFRMRPNSHHFVIYGFNSTIPSFLVPAYDAVRDIRNPDGSMNTTNMVTMGYHTFFGGAMQPEFAYELPPGVALKIPAGTGLDLNVHYANHTEAPISGEAAVNLHTIPLAQVTKVARTLNWGNQSIILPAGQRTTLERTFTVTDSTTIITLTSHTHRLGERFVIRVVGGARDGEMVYESTDWEHPAFLLLPQPVRLGPGQGLKSIVTYNNTTAATVRFGLQSTDEMGIIFGYAY
jgi:hypothetical protein